MEDLVVDHPCIRLRLQRFQQSIPSVGLCQLAAVRHPDRILDALNGHLDLRGFPFCIQVNAFGGHGFVFKHILIARALFIFIPTIEVEVFINMLRPLGFVVCAVNRILIFKFLCFFYITVVYKFDIVFLAVIVEFGTVVILTCFGADIFYEIKTGNGILVIFGNRSPRSRRSVLTVQHIPYTVLGYVNLIVGQSLDIVIGGCAATIIHGAIEFGAIQRHGVNVYLSGITVPTCFPFRTAIYRRPILRDICPIFGFDTKVFILFCAPFVVELHLILISTVIHIQNGRAIACDGFTFGLNLGKALIVRRVVDRGQFACLAFFGFGLCKRILLIVGVFLPVDHGVLDIALRLPVCRNGGFHGNSIDLFTILIIPADKVIACPGGRLNLRKIQLFAFNDKLRGNVAAAVRIKGDPIAVFHHRKQRARAFGKRNVFQRVAVLRCAPALHGLVALQSRANLCLCRGNILWVHGIAFSALRGVHHGIAVFVHKVHIAAGFLESGIHIHDSAGNFCDFAAFYLGIGLLIEPALKNIAVFWGVGRSGNFQLVACGNSLGPFLLLFFAHKELIGIHLKFGCDAEGLHCAAKPIADRIFESVPFRSAVFCRGFLELCSISLVRRHIGIVGGPASEGVFHITVGLFNRGFGGLCVFHLFCTGALGKCFGKDRFALAHPSYGKLFCFGKLGFVSLVGRYRLIRMIPAREDVNKLIVCLLNRGFGRLCVFHLFCTGAFGKLCFRQHRFTVFPSYGKLGFAFGLLTFGVFGSVRDTVFRRVSRRLLRLRLFIVGLGSGLIRHGGTGLGLLSLIGFSLSGLSLTVLGLAGLSLLVFRLLSIGLSSLTLDDISLCDITFFALVFVALALFDFRDAWGALYEILGQNAGGEHGKHHGNGKDHGNDSFFHRFFLLFFQIFSTLAGG